MFSVWRVCVFEGAEQILLREHERDTLSLVPCDLMKEESIISINYKSQ